MTTYTPAQKQSIVTALKAAKPFMWDGVSDIRGKYLFICFAISGAGRKGLINPYDALVARSLINSRLDGWGTIDNWLMYSMGIPPAEITPERLQPYRLAWVDKLIEEFSS